MNKKISLIVVVGTTASGKSEFAVRLAKKYHGEIISADSRQIYRKLDIGTAKVKGVWKKNLFLYKHVPHFCIDMSPPQRIYTVAAFKQDAQHAINAIITRHHIPIVVGGSGFWINALIYDMDLPSVPPHNALRKKLEKKSTEELLKMLKKMDPKRADEIEQKNPRRLIRAIEIAYHIGHVPTIRKKHPYHALWIGMSSDQARLHRNITLRARRMVSNGLILEIKKLRALGISKKRIRAFGFEYIAALQAIEKQISSSQLVKTLTNDTIRYAKRQMRWFKRNNNIQWITSYQEGERLVKKFLKKR